MSTDEPIDSADHSPRSVTSRYADIDGVQFEPSTVPESFRHLLPLAMYWSIDDDVERIEVLISTPKQQLQELIGTVEPLERFNWNWCASLREKIPIPDEVVVYDALLQAASEAKIFLRENVNEIE
ncbi:MAG: hypothetical protein JNJ77_08350 [Planctomycetia bacterium]|nr:hypothetical protein [Planctomycetia bacterium]